MRHRNIRVNKAFYRPEPLYRYRVTVPGMEPVNVVSRTIMGAMERAAPVFDLPLKAVRRRASYELLGVVKEGSEPDHEGAPEETVDSTWPPQEAVDEDWPPPEMKEPRSPRSRSQR